MITHYAGGEFFEFKRDAEHHRKSNGLAPGSTVKVRIDNSEQLARFLNHICRVKPSPDAGNGAERPVEFGIPDALIVDDADIPEFLRKDWARYREGAAS